MRLIIIICIVLIFVITIVYCSIENENSIVSASDIVSNEKLILDPDIFIEGNNIKTFTETKEAELVYLIFGRSACKSCSLLLEAIQNSSSIRNILKDSYKVYFIELDDNKDIIFNNIRYTHNMFLDKFSLSMLPVSLFMYGDKELIRYDGLINRERFKETLLFLKDNGHYLLSKDEISEKLSQIYKEKGI